MQTLFAALQAGRSHTGNQQEARTPYSREKPSISPLLLLLSSPLSCEIKTEIKSRMKVVLFLTSFGMLISTAFTCIPQIILLWQHLIVIAEIPLQYRVWQTHLTTTHLVQA